MAGFFDRRDAVPGVAEGWDLVEGGVWRSNIFSYPPIGSPDSGAHATADDRFNFLDAVRAGRLMTPDLTQAFLTPQVARDDQIRYGFGLEFPPINTLQGRQRRRGQYPAHPLQRG